MNILLEIIRIIYQKIMTPIKVRKGNCYFHFVDVPDDRFYLLYKINRNPLFRPCNCKVIQLSEFNQAVRFQSEFIESQPYLSLCKIAQETFDSLEKSINDNHSIITSILKSAKSYSDDHDFQTEDYISDGERIIYLGEVCNNGRSDGWEAEEYKFIDGVNLLPESFLLFPSCYELDEFYKISEESFHDVKNIIENHYKSIYAFVNIINEHNVVERKNLQNLCVSSPWMIGR